MKRIFNILSTAIFCVLMTGIVAPSKASAQPFFSYQNWCQIGGQTVMLAGLPSTNVVQQSFPRCTVTVFLTGTTTLATIFSDSTGTALANPFTANTDASFKFYAAQQIGYDITISAGGIPAPRTFVDVCLACGTGGGGGATFPSVSAPVVNLTTTTSRNAVAADIIGLFGGSCTGTNVLQANGVCGAGGGGSAPQVAGSVQAANSSATALFTNGNYNSDALGGLPSTLASGACPSGANCNISIPQTTSDTTDVASLINTQSHVHIQDNRFGQNIETFANSGSYASSPSGIPLGYGHNCLFTLTPAIATGFSERNCQQDNEINTGSGVNTGTSASSPFGATNQWSQSLQHLNNFFTYMSGINQQWGNVMYCFKAGDCAQEDNIMFYRSAAVQASDESVEHKVINTQEANPPAGTVTSHSGNFVTSNFTQNGNNAAQGLPLIDYSATGPSGRITGQTAHVYPVLNTVTTSDTHAVSTAIGTFNGSCGSVTIPDQPANVVCATTTTSGAFVTGVVTIGDSANIEQSNLIVSGSTFTYTMTAPHPAGTPIYQGGLAGYVIIMGNGYPDIPTLLAKNSPSIHLTSYFIAGSPTATTYAVIVPYKNNQNGQLGIAVPAITSVPINSEVRLSGGATTITPNGNAFFVYNNLALTQAPLEVIAVTGAGTGFNETITNPTADGAGVHFVSTTTTPGTSTGGTLQVTGIDNYFTAPYANVIQVMDVSMGQFGFPVLSGRLEVAPNIAPWSTNDLLIQANGDSVQPRPVGILSNGSTPSLTGPNLEMDIAAGGEAYSGATIFRIDTFDDAFFFKGEGGTYDGHVDITINDLSAIDIDISNQPLPEGSLIHVGCTLSCTGPNISPYFIFSLQTIFGPVFEQFFPSTGDRIYNALYQAATLKTAESIVFNPGDLTQVSSSVRQNVLSFSTASGVDDATLTSGLFAAPTLLAGATSPTVFGASITGTPAATDYKYVVTSGTSVGETVAIGNIDISTGPTTLGSSCGSGCITAINMAAGGAIGAQTLNFYRISTSGGLTPTFLGSSTSGQFSDIGQAGTPGRTPPTVDTSGCLTLSGQTMCGGAGVFTTINVGPGSTNPVSIGSASDPSTGFGVGSVAGDNFVFSSAIALAGWTPTKYLMGANVCADWTSGNSVLATAEDTAFCRTAANTVRFGMTGTTPDASGTLNFSAILGPTVAPSGTCSGLTGKWEFSQDGHATFCDGTNWVTKI